MVFVVKSYQPQIISYFNQDIWLLRFHHDKTMGNFYKGSVLFVFLLVLFVFVNTSVQTMVAFIFSIFTFIVVCNTVEVYLNTMVNIIS